MISTVLQTLFTRELMKLRAEIESYKNESNLWKVDKNIANSSGNLCLHLVGNLNTYIGAVLGKSGYVRDREAEFALKNIPRQELIKKIDATIEVINRVLPTLNEKDLSAQYPLVVLKDSTTTEFFLVHLAMHLSYHLGQVNYHRRLLD